MSAADEDAALRAQRRDRVLDAMHEKGIGALVLGHPGNVYYATGARRQWLSGTRPFAPGCVLVRATGAANLLMTNSTAGVPPEIGIDRLTALTWNPQHALAALLGVEGLPDAKSIGVDGLTPDFLATLTGALPGIEIVDAAPLMSALRAVKSDAEVSRIQTATRTAADVAAAAAAAVVPGVTERSLLGVLAEAMAAHGVTTPALVGSCVAIDADGRRRRLSRDRAIRRGDYVAIDAGLLVDGYEGGAGRTLRCGESADAALRSRARLLWQRLVDRCVPGSTGVDLVAAYLQEAIPVPVSPPAHGVGVGMEAPIAPDDVLRAGMVLSLTAYVPDPGTGGWFHRGIVHVSAAGPRPLGDAP